MARTEAEVGEQLTFLKSLYSPSPVIFSDSEGSYNADQNEISHRVRDDNIVLHLDVMDGQFVPEKTILNYVHLRGVQAWTPPRWNNVMFDIHFMTSDPSGLLDKLPKTKIRYVYCHAELDQAVIKQFFIDCLNRNFTPALAVNPDTAIDEISNFKFQISNSDLPASSYQLPALLLMSVKPGNSGRSFDPRVVAKIAQIKKDHPNIFVTVDGGINRHTISQITGANCAVVHSAIFNAKDPKEELETLQSQ